jgi:branched-subunit amino acid permease
MEKHLLTPTTTNGLGPGKHTLLTEIIIACFTGAAGGIDTCGETVRTTL